MPPLQRLKIHFCAGFVVGGGMEVQKSCRTTSHGPEIYTQCAAGMEKLKIGEKGFPKKVQAMQGRRGHTDFECNTHVAPPGSFFPCKFFNKVMREKVRNFKVNCYILLNFNTWLDCKKCQTSWG